MSAHDDELQAAAIERHKAGDYVPILSPHWTKLAREHGIVCIEQKPIPVPGNIWLEGGRQDERGQD